MANGAHDFTEWVPGSLEALSKLPSEVTLPLAAFCLAGFAIWAMHSVAKGRP